MPILSLFLQAGADAAPFWPTLGVGGGIAVLVIGMWRLDRNESQKRYETAANESQQRYAALAKESSDRYSALAKESSDRAAELARDFRAIVQDNTRAVTALGEKIGAFSDNNAVTVRLLVEAMRTGKVVNVPPDPAAGRH